MIFLELNGFRVELIEDGSAKNSLVRPDPPAHTSYSGISQFAFETTNIKAIENALKTKEVKIVRQFENADLGVEFLFIRDPEDNLIQFLERLN